MKNVKVIKIGGNVIDNNHTVNDLVVQISRLRSEGNSIVIVHGGGKIATQMCDKLNIKTSFIDGRRITDRDSLDVAIMVYAGSVNKQIVAKLNVVDCKAVGLSGIDGLLIESKKKKDTDIDYGFVGQPIDGAVNLDLLSLLINNKYMPVIAPLTVDNHGVILNTNADTIAQSVAVALSQSFNVELIYIFEHKGVLSDVTDENSVIELINEVKYQQLKVDGVINNGMLPKMENAFFALDKGVAKIVITDSLLANRGTQIVK